MNILPGCGLNKKSWPRPDVYGLSGSHTELSTEQFVNRLIGPSSPGPWVTNFTLRF